MRKGRREVGRFLGEGEEGGWEVPGERNEGREVPGKGNEVGEVPRRGEGGEAGGEVPMKGRKGRRWEVP